MNRTRLSVSVAALAAAVAWPVVPTASAHVHHQRSPRGVIVWTNRADDGSEHLLVARADGRHQRPLTPSAPDTFDFDAQISPDGRWVAYERDTPDTGQVRLVRPDGSDDHAVDVGCTDPCAAAVSPTWLSNHRLAFSLINGPFDEETGNAAAALLWSARIDGSHRRQVSPSSIAGVYEDSYLRVSRDGSYLTFKRGRNADFASALFRMATDGSHVRQLTPWDIGADVNDLSLARHGVTKDLIVFDSYGRGDPDATFVDIATVPATCRSLSDCTAKIRWLTDNGASGRRNANPQWSPDGSHLVFTDRSSIDEPNAEIWTMRYGGDTRHQISTSPNFDYRPTWGR